ncbi:MAG: hypothetical protein P1V18_04370 [Candidatus Gracilibacteria bacterium]|nr:hypothetical protein [Candidatus Gracilibacteria bacterium]
MTNKNLQDALNKTFCDQSQQLQRRQLTKARMKESIMSQVIQMSVEHREEEIVKALEKTKVRVPVKMKHGVRNTVMNHISEAEKKKNFAFENGLLMVMRRGFALTFAVILLVSVALGPLHSISGIQIVQNVRAAYIKCSGTVTINDELCLSSTMKQLAVGDRIQTTDQSTATVFHANFARTYLSQDTYTTLLGSRRKDDGVQILVNEGKVWHYSPSEVSFVKTDSMTAEINGGAISIATKAGVRGQTDVFATVPYKVQIDDRKNNSTKLTLLDVERVSINNRSRNFRTSTIVRNDNDTTKWVEKNIRNDEEHLATVKKGITEDSETLAGNLPGNVGDSLGKIAQSAKIVLTPAAKDKRGLQMVLLEELFSEAIVLAEKGDKAIALETFQSYRENFASLVLQNFDRVLEDADNEKGKELALFEEHQEIVSLYQPNDPAYFLRESFVGVALDLEPFVLGKSHQEVVQNLASTELIQAHKSSQQGNIDLARQHLESYQALLDTPAQTKESDQPKDEFVETDDLVILKDIAQRSNTLKPLVQELAQKKITGIKDLASDKLPQTVTTGTVIGTAYKEPETDRSTTKIVGLAVKEDEAELSL